MVFLRGDVEHNKLWGAVNEANHAEFAVAFQEGEIRQSTIAPTFLD